MLKKKALLKQKIKTYRHIHWIILREIICFFAFVFLHAQNSIELKTKDFVSIQTKDKQNFFWYTKRQEKKNKKKENKKEKKRVRETCGIKKDRSQKKVARGRAGPTLYINNHNDKEDICIIKMKSTKLLQRKKGRKKNLRFTTSWKSVHVSCSEFLIFNVYAPEKKSQK